MRIRKPEFPKLKQKKSDKARAGAGKAQMKFPRSKITGREKTGRDPRQLPYTYIKIVLVAALLVFIILDMANDPISSAKIETVAENVVKAADFQGMEQAEARMVKRFYGLNPKDYEGAVLYAPVDNMDAHELFLVKLEDVSQMQSVQDAIEERLDTQLKSFAGYGAEQTALLEKHVFQKKGNYALYVVGEHAEDARKAFLESL